MTHKKQWIGYVEASSERLLKEQSDAQKAVSHCAALIESRWLEKAHVMNIVLFLFIFATLIYKAVQKKLNVNEKPIN